MAPQKELYYLNIEEFDSVVKNFTESLSGYAYTREDQPNNHIIFRFKKESDSKPCSILNCYISRGRVSFYADGKDKSIAETCKNQLISQTELKIPESKTFTIKPVSIEDVNTVTEFLCEECECTKETLENSNATIHSTFKITGKYKDTIRFTHYNNGTLLVQGRPCLTFSNFIDIATELFNPAEVKKEHLKLFEVSDIAEVIQTNLETHLPNAYQHIGQKLDAIMAPSLILLNNAQKMSDYSACAFPVLRGIEGVLKKTFQEEGIMLKTFKDFFRFNTQSNCQEWAKDYSSLFPNNEFRKSILVLYRFYHAHRHTTFHIDATIEGSRTLQYTEALNIVTEGLRLIDELYIHLN